MWCLHTYSRYECVVMIDMILFTSKTSPHLCTCKVISNFSIWQMWRNLKFFHMTKVCGAFLVFCHILCCFFWHFFCELHCFVAKSIYALLCGDKWSPKLCLWRKKDKYEVWSLPPKSSSLSHAISNITIHQCPISYSDTNDINLIKM